MVKLIKCSHNSIVHSALFLTKEKAQPMVISLKAMDFQQDILLDVFTLFMEGNSQNKDEFFQNTMNFESGFNNFRNFM